MPRSRRSITAAILCLTGMMGVPSVSQESGTEPPINEGEKPAPQNDVKDWEEFGLSRRAVTIESIGMALHLPVECQVHVEPQSDRRLFAEPADRSWSMWVELQRAQDDSVTTDSLARGYAVRAARDTRKLDVTTPIPITINGNAASQIIVRNPKPGESFGSWIHTVFNPSPRLFVVFTLARPGDGPEETVRLYRAALSSITFVDPARLAADRALAETAAEATLSSLTESTLSSILAEDRWYRVFVTEVEGGERQLAYYRVRESLSPRGAVNPERPEALYDPAERDEGVLVRLDARYLQPSGAVYDVQSLSWSSFDRTMETWSVRSAINLKREDGTFAPPVVSTLTGNMVGEVIDIVFTDAGRAPDRITLRKPARAYLPQAFRSLMYRALCPYTHGTYGMLTYEPSIGKIAYRVESIEAAEPDSADGAAWVATSKLTADSPPNTIVLTADGNLIKIVKPNGEITLLSSLEEIRQKWREAGLPTGSLN